MTKQREQLQLLTEKLNYYQGEIQKLTMHPNGKSYGKCIRQLPRPTAKTLEFGACNCPVV